MDQHQVDIRVQPRNHHWRIRLFFQAVESRWRVQVVHGPASHVDAATIRIHRFDHLPEAVESFLDHLYTTVDRIWPPIQQRLMMSFDMWANGRPGLKPRSGVARKRLDDEADAASTLRIEIARAVRTIRTTATEQGFLLRARDQPSWIEAVMTSLAAAHSDDAIREAITERLSEELAQAIGL